MMKKLRYTCILLFVALIIYVIGFGQGQASVYKKARNDINLMHVLYGSEKK